MKTFSTFSLWLSAIFILLVGVSATQAPVPNNDDKDGYKVGDFASDFKLKNIDGNMVSLADMKDAKGFVVIFTCNHCPFSKLYEDRIIALHKKYAAKGFPVIAINPNDAKIQPEDSFENMIVRAKEKNFPFHYLQDETQEVASAYGAARTPHVWVLKKETADKLRVCYVGAIDNNADDAQKASEKYVERALDELLAGRKVSKENTKAIGCTIKWRE
jgi:peroxiredoxin